MLLNGLDWLAIVAFFALLVGIALVCSRRAGKDAQDFFLSGRSMPWWLVGVSMCAATTSTNSANMFTEFIRNSSRSENHCVAGSVFYNVMNYAIRPWPWYLTAFASLIVFPDAASLQKAFPNVDPSLVKGDLAYPAMLTFVPNGWLGVVAASMMGALFSTIAAHLRWARTTSPTTSGSASCVRTPPSAS